MCGRRSVDETPNLGTEDKIGNKRIRHHDVKIRSKCDVRRASCNALCRRGLVRKAFSYIKEKQREREKTYDWNQRSRRPIFQI
jgi:hypothetical protein